MRQLPAPLIAAVSWVALVACRGASARSPHFLAQPAPELRAFTRTMVAAAVQAALPDPAAPSPPPVHARPVQAKVRGRQVRFFKEDDIQCPTEALGLVREHWDGDSKATLERANARAVSLGADAIVGYNSVVDANGSKVLTGVAVRCHDLTEKKDYDTLGQVDVPMPAGGAEEAFSQLVDQAARMHASLVTDVHVEPRDDGPHVVGAAIRYH